LKPTQSALWLRPPVPLERRNPFYRGFNAAFGAAERSYVRLIGSMTRYSGVMVLLALVLVVVALWGLARVPTAFLPDEDQGYLIVSAQLPDGAAKERTDAVMQQITAIAKKVPGVDHVVTVSGISVLDNFASLANAGVGFVVLKDWDERLKQQGQNLRAIAVNLNRSLQAVTQASTFALPPPPIQGIGNVGGFTMQVEIRNGEFDYALLQNLADTVVRAGNAQSGLQRLSTSFRSSAPQFRVTVDRIKAETLGITTGNVFAALSTYVGSDYAAQFTKFGHVFQVYTQALPDYRATAEDIRNLKVRAGNGTMTPIGTVAEVTQTQGPLLISLYNLYPTATISGSPAPGFSSGEALDLMDQIGQQSLPSGTGYEWTAMSYQEKAVGSQMYSRWRYCSCISYWLASMRAGFCRSRLFLACRSRCSARSLR
jgi:hydrophobic/amphiphilic exporter-1 (mainly G- bacteria), HAE1 family